MAAPEVATGSVTEAAMSRMGATLAVGLTCLADQALAGGPYVARHPEASLGRVIGDGHCVAYVERAAGAPPTARWRPGARVRGDRGIARGTAIATFGADGGYTNGTGNHAAIYVERQVLQWFRQLTGRDDVQWIDAQATLYQSGHFLKSHSDLDDSKTRAAAYVLNFTKLWERDWGGYLQFFNEDHDIELALRPIFNAMNIFLVPTDHSVGIVSPFAYGDRFSVTGWLRTDSPPGPIGSAS